MFRFEDLDSVTRSRMLEEFRAEEGTRPYWSQRLSQRGLAEFSKLMEQAIASGNEVSLAQVLADPAFWKPSAPFVRSRKTHYRSINPTKAAESLAVTEFNTWYVRGFARRLLEENEELCEVYRAAPAWEPRRECLQHDGRTYPVLEIYNGHRARYWPPPGNPGALSIPVGTNCHHTIRRLRTRRSNRVSGLCPLRGCGSHLFGHAVARRGVCRLSHREFQLQPWRAVPPFAPRPIRGLT